VNNARKPRPLPGLSPAQREIIELVWARGEISASALKQILSAKRDVSRNTARTLLERMEQKGWLKHREEGRTFYYSAVHPRPAAIGAEVRGFIDRICGGSPEVLLSALLDHRGLTSQELSRIRSMLAKAKADQTANEGD
jgi:BlaI family transcriptional regulator, penicillinase repressor